MSSTASQIIDYVIARLEAVDGSYANNYDLTGRVFPASEGADIVDALVGDTTARIGAAWIDVGPLRTNEAIGGDMGSRGWEMTISILAATAADVDTSDSDRLAALRRKQAAIDLLSDIMDSLDYSVIAGITGVTNVVLDANTVVEAVNGNAIGIVAIDVTFRYLQERSTGL